jgi:hypothetical protein
MPPDPIRRPAARLAGPLLLRCPCGGTIAVAEATDPLVCPVCTRRWQLQLELVEEPPRPAAPDPSSPEPGAEYAAGQT